MFSSSSSAVVVKSSVSAGAGMALAFLIDFGVLSIFFSGNLQF